MYAVKFYITPDDIIQRLSDEDKIKFNQCVFTNIQKEENDGSITVTCVLFHDTDPYVQSRHRQRYFSDMPLSPQE